MPSWIEIERDGPVARVWLNRPEAHNALSHDLGGMLSGALHELAHDDKVRIAVLAGRGPSFCAGADINAMKASANASFEENFAEATKLAGYFAALADFPKPVVARVHGAVYGGGVGLCCASDIVVASDDAKFGLTEVRLGILPSIISAYVIRRLGDRHARELMLTGERFGADVALRAGLANYVVPASELDSRVRERVGELLKGGPMGQRRIKMLLQLYADSPWEEYRSGLPRTLAEVRSSPEAREGLAAFFEKRKPSWQIES